MARSVRWDLIADPRKYQRGFREAEQTTKRFGGMVTKSLGLIGGAFAAIEVGTFLKDAIGEAREAAKVTRQTNAVIKATGGVAHVTARDVDRLASALSNKVGVDDEIIAAGQNMLLTFKGVRNEAGKNNRIFDEATKVALDMTAALNQGEVSQSSLEQTTMRLGKALNDPIKGVSALTRVGVTFTDAQKDQIKTLVESGKTMDAQKIILKELGTEFGGAAKAASDPWQRLTVVFGNVKEEIGTALLPVFEDAANWLSAFLPEAIAKTKEALRTAKKWWDDNYDAIRLLIDLWSDDFTTASEGATVAIDDQRTAAEKLRDALDTLLEWSLRLTQGWDILAQASQIVSIGFLNIVKVAGKVINVVDKLSGGTGHAGDEFVNFADVGLEKAHRMLNQVREDAKRAQERIDQLHGKNVNITGTTSLQFTKSFSQQDWLAARFAADRMAAGGMITAGTGPTADDVLIWASRGEAVVPAKAAKDPGFQRWAGAQGIPGFAGGGLIGGIPQTGTAYSGVGRMMDHWGTILVAAAVKRAMEQGRPGVKNFIRSVDPLPYIWGAAGPGGYDCSGLVSAVLGKHLGNPAAGHGLRYFTTSSIHSGIGGIKPGLGGVLQIGVTAGTGHMAGRYGGLGFEAESSRTGIKVGAAASPPESFARQFHLAKGGLIDPRLLRGYDIGGDPGRLRINGKVLDTGGWLMPGQFALNLSSRPERVLPPGAGTGPAVVVNVQVSGVVGNTREVADRLAPEVYTALKRVAQRNGKQRLAALL